MAAVRDVEETATQTAVAATVLSAPARSRVPPQLAAHCFPPGISGNPKGRPLGAKTQTILSRTETKLARKYVQKALTDGDKEQGAMLRHAIDKFVPDAGLDLRDALGSGMTVIVITETAMPRPLTVPADVKPLLSPSGNPLELSVPCNEVLRTQ